MSVSCRACGEALPATARFCPECGTARQQPGCPACGAAVGGGRFCAECGSPLPGASGAPAGAAGPVAARVSERRVTSVLFADLVGFTALSEARDAEEVRELLSRYFTEARTVIGRYGGTVEKFIGDAVMAVWGVPVAQEDDAERTVRAGLDLSAMVAALGEEVGAPGLALRVGVVTGEVAVTVGATAEGMVAGDAVNTAARVQSAAQPGRVWVDEATRSLTAGTVLYEDVGTHAMKGKAEPARLFEAQSVVAGRGGAQRIDGLEPPFSGRERQLRLVKELCHQTTEEGRPRLVLVTGVAGVGKSRLAWEFEKYVDGLAETWAWHRGRCLAYGDGIAFWALAEVVRGRLRLAEGDHGPVVEQRLAERMLELVPDPEEREWVAPRLAALLGTDALAYPREDLFAAWTRFLDRAGQGHPVVVVLDDLHLADDGLLDFVEHLLASATSAVHVLGLARPELLERRPALSLLRRVTVLHLEPLGPAPLAAVVDGLVEGLTPAARDALVARADGIPLYAVETVRALIDRDVVVPSEGRYVLAPGAVLDLATLGPPASLQALVASRLDTLPPGARRLVGSASVLGLSFTRAGLRALEPAVEGLDGQVAELVRREVLAVQTDGGAADPGRLRFVQAVVRQVAYDMLARRDRRAAHLAAAAHLLTEDADELAPLIAQHYLDAVDAGSPADPDGADLTRRAVDLLDTAAVRALGLGANREALRLYRTALDRSRDPQDHLRLLEGAARAARLAGQYDECVELAHEVLAALGSTDPVRAAETAAVAGWALATGDRLDEAIGLLSRHLAGLPDLPGADEARLALLEPLSGAAFHAGATEDAERYRGEQLRLAERLGDPVRLVGALVMSGIIWCSGGLTVSGQAFLTAAADLARAHHARGALTRALANGYVFRYPYDLPGALALGREAVEAARSGSAELQGLARVNLLTGLHLAGAWSEAADLLDAVRHDGGGSAGADVITTAALWWRYEAGVGPAPAVLAGAAEDTNDLNARAWVCHVALHEARDRGDLAGAARCGSAGLEAATSAAGLLDDFPLQWPVAVLASLAAGDADLARRQVALVAQAPPGLVSALLAAQLPRLQGQLAAAAGADQEVEALLHAGIEALDAYGAVPDRARTQQALAAWLLDRGRSEDAVPLLDAARTTYQRLGARRWLAELDRLAPAALRS